ncbi:hypothetical protein MLD38_033106 [Melastoma candidum]|uniref:Uncharacterized protein n=1 Tax=Melastoma candidum TaxID=119954 RepID=A0ACB9M7Y9_9MYRT|nr:hypothetical protein MLD38_033106 [Melastoma candidum]
MGLWSLPAPSEGMLYVLLVNTAFSISFFKGIVQAILDFIGFPIRLWPYSSPLDYSSDAHPQPQTPNLQRTMVVPSDSYMDLFRARMRAVRFDESLGCCDGAHECPICLNEFVPESEINVLSCGHVFHGHCLEKWLVYWNITCPLCRAPFMPEDEAPFPFC